MAKRGSTAPGRQAKVAADMLAVINVVLPIFGIMLAGYLAGRLGVLGEGSSQALNGFVYYVALPALFFISLARVPVAEAIDLPFLAAYGGGILGVFGLAIAIATFVFPNRLGALGLHAMSATFANTGYMGVPLLLIAYGDAARLPAILTTIVNGVLMMGAMTVILEVDAHAGNGVLKILRKVAAGVFKSPLLLSAAAGLGASAVGFEPPQALGTFCDLLGVTAGPCALFAIGLFMVGKKLRHGLGEVLWVSLLKLVAQPLVTWWLAYDLLHLSPVFAASAVMMAALPTGALAFVLAQRYEVYIQRSTSVILVSTVLSVASLTVLFLLIGVE